MPHQFIASYLRDLWVLPSGNKRYTTKTFIFIHFGSLQDTEDWDLTHAHITLLPPPPPLHSSPKKKTKTRQCLERQVHNGYWRFEFSMYHVTWRKIISENLLSLCIPVLSIDILDFLIFTGPVKNMHNNKDVICTKGYNRTIGCPWLKLCTNQINNFSLTHSIC